MLRVAEQTASDFPGLRRKQHRAISAMTMSKMAKKDPIAIHEFDTNGVALICTSNRCEQLAAPDIAQLRRAGGVAASGV